MGLICTHIEMEDVEENFEDTDETVNDISVVKITLEKEPGVDVFELFVFIYGKDQNTPVCEYDVANDDIATRKEIAKSGIKPEKIPLIFDEDLRRFLIEKEIPIIWNEGDEETEDTVELAEPGWFNYYPKENEDNH